MGCVNIIISDFDGTLFKRNHGLIQPVVKYLEDKGYPVYIVTYRANDQLEFIEQTISETSLTIAGFAFAGSRKKDPLTKLVMIDQIKKSHHIVEALDDDEQVVLSLREQGMTAHQPRDIG